MSSNKTEYYGFPQYCPHDHPDFLTEINESFKTIDTVLHEIATATGNDAQMISALSATMQALSEQVNLLSERVAKIEGGTL